jgi:hypothetical protein
MQWQATNERGSPNKKAERQGNAKRHDCKVYVVKRTKPCNDTLLLNVEDRGIALNLGGRNKGEEPVCIGWVFK